MSRHWIILIADSSDSSQCELEVRAANPRDAAAEGNHICRELGQTCYVRQVRPGRLTIETVTNE